MTRPTVTVEVTADGIEMPIHEETRSAFNAGIRASERAVREAARAAGVPFTAEPPHREGDVYTRVWRADDGSDTLRVKVEVDR